MFKAKYGYDYSESVMNDYKLVGDINFLNDEFEIQIANGFKTKYYSLSKELLAKKSSTIDLQQYLTREFLDFKYSEPLVMLDPDVTMADYESMDEFYKAFAQKYSDDEKEIEKVKLVFSEKLSDNNFDYFMEYVTKTIIGMSKSPEHVACYFRELYKEVKREFKVDDIEEKFNNKMQDELVKHGMDEAIDLYLNSDIEFDNYWIVEPNNAVLPEEYNRIEKTENYVLTDSGYLVVKTQENEDFWNAKYGEETIYLTEVTYKEDIEYYSEMFDSSEGNYYSAHIYSDLNIDTIDEDKINVYVSHIEKTQALGTQVLEPQKTN